VRVWVEITRGACTRLRTGTLSSERVLGISPKKTKIMVILSLSLGLSMITLSRAPPEGEKKYQYVSVAHTQVGRDRRGEDGICQLSWYERHDIASNL